MTPAERDEIGRIHERIDEVLREIAQMRTDLASLCAECRPCRATVDRLNTTVYGNGHPGLIARVEALRTAAPASGDDRLSVKATTRLLGAFGTLIAAVSAAIASVVSAAMARS